MPCRSYLPITASTGRVQEAHSGLLVDRVTRTPVYLGLPYPLLGPYAFSAQSHIRSIVQTEAIEQRLREFEGLLRACDRDIEKPQLCMVVRAVDSSIRGLSLRRRASSKSSATRT